MKRLGMLLVLLFSAAICGASQLSAAPGPGSPAIEIKPSKANNDGGRKKLSDFTGYVLLAFWATW